MSPDSLITNILSSLNILDIFICWQMCLSSKKYDENICRKVKDNVYIFIVIDSDI